jgi:tellurite resistance protein
MSITSPPGPATGPLKYLVPGWYAVVMGLAGLSLAWRQAGPVMGEGAALAALALGGLAAAVFCVLAVATVLRARRYPQAWAEDRRHPVRHAFIATLPVSLLLLATVAVAAGLQGAAVQALWWAGTLAQLGVTGWILARWWKGAPHGGLTWAGVTPALLLPVVGQGLVPLAGVPLGQPEWSAAMWGIGLLFWPVITALLLVRIAVQGLWAERLLPANFLFIAPPAVAGLAALQFGAPPLLAWALWGLALFSLLWVLPLLRRIANQPWGLLHWSMSFPLAAFTALSLRLMPSGPPAMLGVALLAVNSLLVAALASATVRGLRQGSLLVAEAVPIAAAPPVAATPNQP